MNDIKEIMADAMVSDFKSRLIAFVSSGDAMAIAQFQIEKLEEDGFVIVPKEPNREMLELYVKALSSDMPFSQFYKAMIEASQGGDV